MGEDAPRNRAYKVKLNSHKVVIIGPGALGCLFAARLSTVPNHQVWILDHKQERADHIERHGITVLENDSSTQYTIHATTNVKAIGTADLIFLCVKSYDVQASLDQYSSLFHGETLLIALQNGISHLPHLSSLQETGHFAAGVTAMGATLTGTGEIRFGGTGPTHIGFVEPQENHAHHYLKKTAHLLTSTGIKTYVEGNIREKMWAKLMVNVGINALSVIHHCRNGELLENPEAKKMLTDAVLEAKKVASGLGIQFDLDPLEQTLAVCRATAQNTSSMLQDILKKRPTEIDAINGAVIAEARNLGINTPINDRLVQLVKQIEKKELSK